MLANLDAVLHAGVKDELGVLAGVFTTSNVRVSWMVWGFENHKECLDNVVTMHIHCEFNNISLKSLDDLVQSNVVDTFLNSWIEFKVLNDFNS